MRLSTIFIALALCGAATPALAIDLSAPYSPTRSEWLQSTLYRQVTQVTDSWRRRVGVSVIVIQKDQQLVVTITSANGQAEPTQQERASYVNIVESISKSVVANFDWAKEIKIVVQFI